jgi:hypothetical protein
LLNITSTTDTFNSALPTHTQNHIPLDIESTMVSPRRTRSANASKHPAAVLKGKAHRSSAEVQAEAKVKAAAKAAKQEKRNAHIRSVAEFEREAMSKEDAMDATPRPNFASGKCSTGRNYDLNSTDVDEPNTDGDTYLPPDGSADDLESEDLAETVDATPVPASKRKKNAAPAAATKKTKPNATGKPKSKASKQLDDIEEDSESEEEPLVSKKGPGSMRKGRLIVEDSETSDRDLPPTKKSRVSDEAKPGAKSTRGKKESIREAISAINQGHADMKGRGGTAEVVVKGKAPGVSEQEKRLGDGPQWSKRQGDSKENDESGPTPVKRSNQNMSQDLEHGDAAMYVTCFFLTSIMLTLDTTTLFYWTLSDPPSKKIKYSIESWAKTIPSNIKPASRVPSLANSAKTGKSSINRSGESARSAPALTSASSRADSCSVLTSEITITSAHHDVPVKVKQDSNSVRLYDGGLSDHEEMTGVERDAAHASPIKGRKRLNSQVSTSDRLM